jgi:PAS domain S-box-containing protein
MDMDILWWIGGNPPLSGRDYDLSTVRLTVSLGAAVALGYAVIATNWYFQSRLAGGPDAHASLVRLRGIVAGSAVAGVVFLLSDAGWPLVWLYHLTLFAIACHTWWFVFRRMRGFRGIRARLAHVAELERSAQRYREIAELLPQVVWTATADGHVDFSNQRWREYAGDRRSWLDAVHPDERDTVARWWDDALAAPRAVAREVRLLASTGAYRAFRVEATPVVHGAAVQWFGACADVEDQKRVVAEKESQAKQKEFLFNALSHDLRAPLNNVVLNAQLLKTSAQDVAATNAEFQESADIVIENALAAGHLVTQLLDFARMGAHDHNRLARVSMADVLHQVERRFAPVAAAKDLYLRVTGDRNADLTTDRLKLERIVSNLVDNAIKFTASGGVTLDLAARDAGLAVRISDTGVGIPADDVPHLFDEFYQADNQDGPHAKGFGMGLAICRSLARQLHGDVTLAHTGPDGTCFEFTVRDTHTASAAQDHAEQPSRVPLVSRAICQG